MNKVSADRLARLREALSAQGLDAYLVRHTTDIAWLTGFDGVFDSEAAHALVVTAQDAILHTDSRYSAACLRASVAQGGAVSIDSAVERHEAFCTRLLDNDQCLGIEDDIPLREYLGLQEAGLDATRMQALANLVFDLRAVKDAREIARLQAAQDITDAAFAHIIGFIRPGMTEREVQRELEGYMLDHGAEALSFSSIVATGANGASPHAIPGQTVIERGQCVVIDFGCVFQGYCSDMTRTVFIGQPSAFMKRAYDAMRDANEQVEAMLRPGITGIEAHNLACQVLADWGFADKMGHGLGHGVGLDIHEQPNLNSRNLKPLKVGNVVTVEPGIYLAPGDVLLAGKAPDGGTHAPFGMRLEDYGVIAADGLQVFTKTSHDAAII